MKGIYKIGILALLLFIITTASAATQIGDNITVANNVTAQNFIGNLSWTYLLGIPSDFPNSTLAGYNGNFPNSTVLTKTDLNTVNQSANLYNVNGSNITSGKIDSSFLNITNISSYLSGDKAASGSNLYVVGPNITNLPAGTWFLTAGVTVTINNAGATCNMSQNTSGVIHVISSGEGYGGNNEAGLIYLSGVISLGSPATVQVACAGNGQTVTIKGAPPNNAGSAGNTASYIIALRIG